MSVPHDQGLSVCSHRRGYRCERLEAALLDRFRAAMTPPIVSALADAMNHELEAALRAPDARVTSVKAELLRLERDAANLVRFFAGGESFSVRDQLREMEGAIEALHLELATLEASIPGSPRRANAEWIRQTLEHLDALLGQRPQQANTEIARQLDGGLTAVPVSATGEEPRLEIRGRAKLKRRECRGAVARTACGAASGATPGSARRSCRSATRYSIT